MDMQENAEYCTGQEFSVVFTSELSGFRLWQCKQCAYEFSQRPLSDERPVFPSYHPKPVPMRIAVTEQQRQRLRALAEIAHIAEDAGMYD